jgi:hypothetical protein
MANPLTSKLSSLARRLSLSKKESESEVPLSEADRILRSGLFDEIWYRERHLIENESSHAAAQHYIEHSGLLKIRPHPLFDEFFYFEQALKLPKQQHGLSALSHFIEVGSLHDLSPHKLFDPVFYRSQLKEALPGWLAFQHFLITGGALSPHKAFDSNFY